MLLLLYKTLKGSRNIQGFALIRAVLFCLYRRNLIAGITKLNSIVFYKHPAAVRTKS